MSDFAAVSASSAIAARQGNRSCSPKRAWGHAPAGAYLLSGHARNTGAPRAEYGDDLFLFRVWFNRVGDESTAARHNGRKYLLAYGGAPDARGNMRRTQGGIRLSAKMIAEIRSRLSEAAEGTTPLWINLRTLKQRTWWAPWRKQITVQQRLQWRLRHWGRLR